MHEKHRPQTPRYRPHPASPHGAIALPATASAFRLLGGGSDPSWIGDDMGGIVDPDAPRPTRREFLIRAAVAVGALSAGGAVNVLAMALARYAQGER